MKTFRLFLKSCILIFPFFIICTSCNENISESDPIRDKKYKDAIVNSHQKIVDYMYTSSVPGVAVSVSHKGKLIWSDGLGKASVELNVPVNRKTKFRIGNTSEMFTTYLIALLQQKGTLNVDSSLYHYIPKFPKNNYDFTLRMLGTHSAGFNESNIRYLIKIHELKTLKDYVKHFANNKQVYKPDNYFMPAEYGTALLGIVAEEVTEKTYWNLIEEMIIDTLGLTSTVIDIPQITIDDRSQCYDLDIIARLINAPEVNLLPFAPIHGLLSTADDLNIAAQQIVKPGFFNVETIELLTQQHSLKNKVLTKHSFGWWVSEDESQRKILGQIGTTIGGASVIVACPEEELVVTITANKGDDVTQLPSYAVAQIFLDFITEHN